MRSWRPRGDEAAARAGLAAAQGNGLAAQHIPDSDGDRLPPTSTVSATFSPGPVKACLGSVHRQFTSSIEVWLLNVEHVISAQ
ncbi:unnamed protein product [Urochloa humidicola]